MLSMAESTSLAVAFNLVIDPSLFLATSPVGIILLGLVVVVVFLIVPARAGCPMVTDCFYAQYT